MSNIVKYGFDEYQEVANTAINDETYKSDLKAAILAPSIFLQSPKNFETCFDKIVYHLENAIDKCDNPKDKQKIQLFAQEIYHGHIFIIKSKVDFLIEKNNEGFLTKIDNFFKKVFGGYVKEHTVQLPSTISDFLQTEYGPEAVTLMVEYFRVLAKNTKLNEELNLFYIQMFRTYRKVIQTNIYKKDTRLMVNTIKSNIDNINNAISITQTWDEAPHLIAFLNCFAPDEFENTKGNIRESYIKNNFTDYQFDARGAYEFVEFLKAASLITLLVLSGLYFFKGSNYLTIILIGFPCLLLFYVKIFKRIFFALKVSRLTKKFEKAKE